MPKLQGCNREGRQKIASVFVFDPTDVQLRGDLRSVAQSAAEAIGLHESDPLSLDAIEEYFRLHYWQQSERWDSKEIMKCFVDPQNLTFQFRTAAERFKLIEDTTRSVFVAWGKEGATLDKQLRSKEFDKDPVFRRNVVRRMQRFIVPVYENIFNQFVGTDIELINENLAVLINPEMYSDQLGFEIDLAGYLSPHNSTI